jgi:hypothetical protein
MQALSSRNAVYFTFETLPDLAQFEDDLAVNVGDNFRETKGN